MEIFIALNDEARDRRQRVKNLNTRIRDFSDPMNLPDAYFIKLFRLSKHSVNLLVTRLGPGLMPQNSNGVLPLFKILSCLHFLGHGGYQTTVGHGYTIGLSQPTVSRFLHQVTEGIIANFMDEAIRFPQTSQEKERVKAGFHAMYGMPGVLGAVDGTHVAIVSPPKCHPTHPAQRFYNRKGYYSLNCQMVCDSSMRVINVNANHPGATHDSAIFQLSVLNSFMRLNYLRGNEEWLLGDSGYTQLPWVMTPVDNAVSEPERRYNMAHIRTRTVIENCFGLIKNRWRCTMRDRVLHYSPRTAAQIVYSVAILHNIALQQNDPMPVDPEEESQSQVEDNVINPIYINEENNYFQAARNVRNALISRHF